MNKTGSTILIKSEPFVTNILFYGKDYFKDEVNSLISNAATEFIVSMETIDYHFIVSDLRDYFSLFVFMAKKLKV